FGPLTARVLPFFPRSPYSTPFRSRGRCRPRGAHARRHALLPRGTPDRRRLGPHRPARAHRCGRRRAPRDPHRTRHRPRRSTMTRPVPTATADTATPDSPVASLRLRDVTLEVGDGAGRVRALDRVDLEVHPGELVAVIGPSGAGKSSLLAVSGALAAPTSGEVTVLGQDLGARRGRRGRGAL